MVIQGFNFAKILIVFKVVLICNDKASIVTIPSDNNLAPTAPESGLDGSRISDTVGAAPPCNRSTMTSLFQLQYVVKMPRHYLHPVGDTLQSLGSEEESVFCLIFSVTVIDTGDIIDIISDADAGDADH